jgi:hypothetical protein
MSAKTYALHNAVLFGTDISFMTMCWVDFARLPVEARHPK